MVSTTVHDRTDHQHRDLPAGSCCGARGLASATMAAAILDPLHAPDVRELVSPKDSAAPRGGRRLAGSDSVDLLVLGSIATGNPAQPTVGAMGVTDGRIVALGSADELAGLRSSKTSVVDSGDGTIIPGLIEPHMHLWSTGLFYDWEDCSHSSNPRFDDVVARLKAAAAKAPPGEWVCGQLFDPSLFPGEPELTAAILDRISPNNPMAVTNASMHYIYVNSKVFELAGITAETPDPPGGTFYRHDGKLTGVVGELAGLMAIAKHIPAKSAADYSAAMRAIMNVAASRGVTSMREGLTGQLVGTSEVALLHQMNAAERLPTRISTAQSALVANEKWAEAGVTPMSGDDMVRAVAWKVLADGSNQGRSAYLRTKYLGGMGGTGEVNYTLQELTEYIRQGHEAGWQVMAHANGDAAIDLVLTAYEGALADAQPHDLRHRVEHVAIGHPEHFSRMARSGLSPSFLVNHVYYWGRVLRDNILGPERAAGLHRLNTAVRNGLRVSVHSDYNVSPMHPLLSARTAVLRQTEEDGTVLGPDERVDPASALRAITTDAAWQIHGDDRGSLEVGKFADFAIASNNPWTTDPEGWADITISETRLGGEVAWQA